MLHVILLILKIIGFLFLAVLGLLFGIILLALFVPIRYRAEGSYCEKLEGTIRVTWLLHMLSIMVSYREELQVSIKLFGFCLLRKQGGEMKEQAEDIRDEVLDEAEDIGQIPKKSEADPITNEKTPERTVFHIPEKESETTEQTVLFGFLSGILEKIKFLFKMIYAKLKSIIHSWDKIQEFINDPANKNTFRLIMRQVKALMHHILPRKARGTVTFGFEDPYTTGQVLTAASIFYPWYGKQIQLTPVFDEAIFEGNGMIKGRVRIGTLLLLGIRILLNKNFRVILKRWRSKGGFSDDR